MRNSINIDHLLENAVATALGFDSPHPEVPAHLRPSKRRALGARHHKTVPAPRHDRKVAA